MNTEYILLATVIAGVTELIKRLRARDYWVAVTILSSAVIGGLFGAFGIEGLTIIEGIATGFGLSGGMSILGSLGNKSTAQPSEVVVEK